ncbi:MAG: CopG family transcriptional regulator [Deltaproteobacteria bacterium]|nr:MAG: CopG family transcriptional regulator [Deltaproteobacteria bacterium]
MLAVRLPEELERRLDHLAKSTGRTKTFYVQEAIERHTEDMEDLYSSLAVLEDIKTGKEELLDDREMWDDLDD